MYANRDTYLTTNSFAKRAPNTFVLHSYQRGLARRSWNSLRACIFHQLSPEITPDTRFPGLSGRRAPRSRFPERQVVKSERGASARLQRDAYLSDSRNNYPELSLPMLFCIRPHFSSSAGEDEKSFNAIAIVRALVCNEITRSSAAMNIQDEEMSRVGAGKVPFCPPPCFRGIRGLAESAGFDRRICVAVSITGSFFGGISFTRIPGPRRVG